MFEANGAASCKSSDPAKFGFKATSAASAEPDAGFRPHGSDHEIAAVAIGLHIDPTDQLFALKDRENVISVASPRFGNEYFDAEMKTEKALGSLSVTNGRVERTEDPDAP